MVVPDLDAHAIFFGPGGLEVPGVDADTGVDGEHEMKEEEECVNGLHVSAPRMCGTANWSKVW